MVTLLGFAVLVRRAVVRVVLAGALAAAFTVVFAAALVLAVLVFFAAAVRAGAARRTAVERPVLRAFAAGFLVLVGVVARAMAGISDVKINC